MMTIRNPALKIAILIASILPFAYMLFFFGFIFYSMMTTFSGTPPNKDAFQFFPVLFIMHFSVIFLVFALLTFYMIYLFRSDRVSQDKKVLWAVLLFLGSFIAMPIFWYLYIWREPAN